MYAFYRGFRDSHREQAENPFPAEGEEARCWDAGCAYAKEKKELEASPPVCRLGPGGDFSKDWPESSNS